MDIPIEKKRFNKTKIGIVVGSILLLTFIIYVIFTSGGNSKLNVDSERIIVSNITKGVFQENIPVNGIVLPITTIYLDALEGGRRKG